MRENKRDRTPMLPGQKITTSQELESLPEGSILVSHVRQSQRLHHVFSVKKGNGLWESEDGQQKTDHYMNPLIRCCETYLHELPKTGRTGESRMKTLTITKETTVNEIENWLHSLPGEAIIRTTRGKVVAKLSTGGCICTHKEHQNFWQVMGDYYHYTDYDLAEHIQYFEPETTIEVIYHPKREPLGETLYISMPMAGRTREEIEVEREEILHDLERAYQETFHLIPLIGEDELDQMPPAEALGESIKRLAQADIVAFADGWENARGCQIEKAVCDAYEIEHLV